MRQLFADARFGIRSLARTPGFTTIAVLTLALGIGANSAIFSFVDGVVLKPLPYREPDRLVRVWEKPPRGQRNAISTLNFLDWAREGTAFESIAAQAGSFPTLTGEGEPVQLRGARVSASYFEVFGVSAAIGRTFAHDEDQQGRDKVVVLSHALWQTRFGGAPSLVGRSIVLDGVPHTVIGILPANSAFDRAFIQLWRPLAFTDQERTRDFHWLTAMGRLKPGVTLETARSRMDVVAQRIAADYPDSNKGWGITIDRFPDVVVGADLRRSLYVLLGAVGLVLLIACVNLANLLLARGTAREREVAVRAALGAGRARLVRQLLTESLVLALSGGIIGLLVGYALMGGLKLLLPPFMLPREAAVVMDGRVLGFTLVVAIATGLLFGIVPALQLTRPDLSTAVQGASRGSSPDRARRRVRSGLVVAEVALAFVLLTGATLLVRSFMNLQRLDTGIDSTNVITTGLPVPSNRFADPNQLSAYQRQVMSRLEAVPGVRGVALASTLPFQGWGYGMPMMVQGKPFVDRANRRGGYFKMISPSYFAVLGIPVKRGRGLAETDRAGAPPAMVINETFVRQYLEKEDPMGKRILVQEIVPGRPELGAEIPWEVVGVVADEKVNAPGVPNSPGMYVSFEQSPNTFMGVLVRTAVEAGSVEQALRRAVSEINKDQPLTEVRLLTTIKEESLGSNRLRTMLLGIMAALAVVLAAIGIYGVISYTVAQRTREIGIRSALGASGATLLRLVIRQSMLLAVVGLLVGLASSLALTHVLSTLLFEVAPRDPLSLAVATVLLTAVSLLACAVPARRAATVDPVIALRYE
jgi:predicted permease